MFGLLFLHLYFSLAAAAASSTDDECSTSTSAGNARRCGLYLARSTIPHSGLGVFTGIPHDVGSSLAPPEIAHQIIVHFQNDDEGHHAPGAYWQSLVHDYTWQSTVTGGAFEAESVESLIPGLGMAANSFLPLVNARSVMGSIDSASVNADGKGPGSGAFSSYHGVTYVAERPLEAGAEIFVDYGDSYFRDREHVYGMIPLIPEFQRADEMLGALWEALPPAVRDGQVDIGHEWQKAWNVLLKEFVANDRVRNAMPAMVTDIQSAATMGTPHQFLRGDNPRTLEWLEANGLCMDHIAVATSDIPHAGRGAFAKRPFATNETIHPLPLLQIPRSVLDLFGNKSGEENGVSRQQLLLNYCIGQKDSHLLLLPYSSTANFINHGGSNANAKLVWADGTSDPMGFHNKEWMEMSAEKLLDQRHAGLLMLVVATRDIDEGEEVTIDYGPEWEKAWLQHQSRWPSEGHQKTAAEYNESEGRIRTILEGSYPPNVRTACHYRLQETQDFEEAERNRIFHFDSSSDIVEGDDALNVELDSRAREQLHEKLPVIEQHAPSWIDHGGRATMSGDYLRPCTILARHPTSSNGISEDMYTARIYNRKDMVGSSAIPPHIEFYVKNIPRRAIIFVDRAGMSDQHHSRAFRHEIGFPDGDAMWPRAWKNVS
eukprot:CCRYP_004881-RA/>CCRYP_004881-RA protein AED:0.03 eAED:0.03 QI:0/-1/0/1/-1/1/1/0/656